MKNLLDKVGIINLKYNLIESENQFNLFSILRSPSDEVNLHSKFIYELINPNGSHNKEKIFLEALLIELDFQDFNQEQVIVTKERWAIDILIRNTKKQAIIIENKIWADDQKDQLSNYFTLVSAMGFTDIRIVYLTPDGHFPSEKSIKNLSKEVIENQLFTISYSQEINNWIDIAIEKCSRSPIIRESLIQYKNLINDLTGNSMNEKMKSEITDLLSEGENVVNAQKIAASWLHVNWTAEWNFWVELENLIKPKYPIQEVSKYSTKSLNSVYNQSRNRIPWYGIMGELFKINQYQICIYIERGWSDLYFGITVVKDGKRNVEFKKQNQILSEKIAKISDDESELWLGFTHIKPGINFTSFSDSNALKMINDDFRKVRVNEIWSEIEKYIEDVKLLLTEEVKK